MGDAFSRIPPDAEACELPGFYKTPRGELFVDAAEVCIAKGVIPTRANQEQVYEQLREIADKGDKAIFRFEGR